MTGFQTIVLRTPDRRFGVTLDHEALGELLRHCMGANGRETGGILIGVYTENFDMALVRKVTGPSPDSQAGRTWFRRGVQGLQELLLDRWRTQKDYYLGEWHFHPGALPRPSGDDGVQMRSIAQSPPYRCPEPVLVILGGDPAGNWTISAHVYPRGADGVEMHAADL
jgi:integrative and conjugative element protein (TIGR02256 family)